MFTQYIHGVAKLVNSKVRDERKTNGVSYVYRELIATNRDGETCNICFLSDEPEALEFKEEGEVA